MIVLQKYSEGVEAGVFVLWHWRLHILRIDGVSTFLHITEMVSNHSLWWVSTFSLTFLRDDVSVSTSETAWTISLASCWRLQDPRNSGHSLVITRALINSVAVIPNRRVLASVNDSGDHLWERSTEILSKQAAMEECRRLTLSRASMHSIYLVLQRSFSFVTLDSGCVSCIASSNLFCHLGWAKKTDRWLTTPIMLRTLTS